MQDILGEYWFHLRMLIYQGYCYIYNTTSKTEAFKSLRQRIHRVEGWLFHRIPAASAHCDVYSPSISSLSPFFFSSSFLIPHSSPLPPPSPPRQHPQTTIYPRKSSPPRRDALIRTPTPSSIHIFSIISKTTLSPFFTCRHRSPITTFS